MQIPKATGLHRKSGGAQWRDLCVDAFSWKCFSTELVRNAGEESTHGKSHYRSGQLVLIITDYSLDVCRAPIGSMYVQRACYFIGEKSVGRM